MMRTVIPSYRHVSTAGQSFIFRKPPRRRFKIGAYAGADGTIASALAKENSNSGSNQNEQYQTCQEERQPSVTCRAACECQKILSVSGFFSRGLLCEPPNSLLLFSFPVVALLHLPADSFYAIALKFRFG
jgi:hypothetical protein